MSNGLSRRQAERANYPTEARLNLIEGELDDLEAKFQRWDRKLTTLVVLVAGMFTQLLVALFIFVLTR